MSKCILDIPETTTDVRELQNLVERAIISVEQRSTSESSSER
jgi:DNA-binding NtrC family response regulator